MALDAAFEFLGNALSMADGNTKGSKALNIFCISAVVAGVGLVGTMAYREYSRRHDPDRNLQFQR